MRKKIYVLVLLFISTSYLFSQTDTSEFKVSQEKEKADFVQYDFYNDYLPSIKTDTFEFTLKREKLGILLARAGIGLPWIGVSVALDIPVIDKLNISSYLYDMWWDGTMLGLGLGVPIKTETGNFILKLNLRPGSIFHKNVSPSFLLNIGAEFILIKSISISPDIFFHHSSKNGTLIISFSYVFFWDKP